MIRRFINYIRSLFGHHETIAGTIEVPAPVAIPEVVETVPHGFPSVRAGVVKSNFNERQMINDAFDDLNKVLASPNFKQRVLTAKFTETNGMSNIDIYNKLVDNAGISVDLTMFTGTFTQNRVYKTMGYEDENYPGVCFANRVLVYDKETLASLILHELMHILGLHHYGVYDTSVPYTMNRIYTATATELHLAAA